MLRLVVDTNLLVSALIRRDTVPFHLYRAWREGAFELITSPAQIDEMTRVMGYAKLQRYVTPEEARSLVTGLATYATSVAQLPVVTASPDPDDNRIIATAIAGGADYLVSGDKRDMLALGEVNGIPIITARTALELCR